MTPRQRRSRESLSSSSSSSSSSSPSSPSLSYRTHLDPSAHGNDVEDVYEQRRARHISAILVRNIVLPGDKVTTSRHSIHTLPRPYPRRSLSTTSSTSTTTLRRTPSNRTVRPSGRRRASSVTSAHAPNGARPGEDNARVYQPPSLLVTWDAASLHDTLYAHFATTFVSLARCGDGQVFYRTPVSSQPGLHHGWGRVPGSKEAPDGLDVCGVVGTNNVETGCSDKVRISLWASSSADRATAGQVVHANTEAAFGFGLLWERDVELRKLAKVHGDLASTSLTLPYNAILLGLRYPLGQVLPDNMDSATPKEARRGGKVVKRGGEVQYYIVAPSVEALLAVPETAKDATSSSLPRDRATIRALLKQGELVRSYDVDDILRLLQLQRQRCEIVDAIEHSRERSHQRIVDEGGDIAHFLAWADGDERLRVQRAQRDAVREAAKAKKREAQDRNETLHRRRARLEIARRLMATRQRAYEDLQRRLTQLSSHRDTMEGRKYARRVVLLRQLEFVYPIDLVDGAELLFSIVGIPLANRDGHRTSGGKFDQPDDETVSSALGMIGQMIALISAYVDTPLHYPIATAGSRSVIQDGISVMSGPRAFPLFVKGVERYRFEYAHFLLNKDIEQLMNHAGITILDIRNTLPNLKNLIVTLTASSQPSSRLSRRHHIGAETISLPASRAADKSNGNHPSLGMGHPSFDARTQTVDQQIGYGTVVASLAREDRATRAALSTTTVGSRWSMSLLGWGGTTDGTTVNKKAAANEAHPVENLTAVPASKMTTVRTLGASE